VAVVTTQACLRSFGQQHDDIDAVSRTLAPLQPMIPRGGNCSVALAGMPQQYVFYIRYVLPSRHIVYPAAADTQLVIGRPGARDSLMQHLPAGSRVLWQAADTLAAYILLSRN